MRISALMAMWMCGIFAVVAYAAAYTAFSGLQTLTDAADRDATLGYAWFWTFLGAIATLFGVLSWLIKKGKFGPVE